MQHQPWQVEEVADTIWRTDFPSMRPEWENTPLLRRMGNPGYLVTDAPVIRLKDRTKERRQADHALIKAGVLEGYSGE